MSSVRKQFALWHEGLVVSFYRARADDHVVRHLRIGYISHAQITPAIRAESTLQSVPGLDLLISVDLDVLSARLDFILL